MVTIPIWNSWSNLEKENCIFLKFCHPKQKQNSFSLKFSHLWSCQALMDEKIAYNFYDAGTIAFHYTVLAQSLVIFFF